MDDASGPCRRVNPAMGRGLEILEDNNGKVVFVNRLGKFGAKKKKKKRSVALFVLTRMRFRESTTCKF